MKKKLLITVFMLVFVLCAPLLMTGCGASLFRIYEYEEGVTISFYKESSDYQSENYKMDFDVVWKLSEDDTPQEVYDYLYGVFEDVYGDSLSKKSNSGGYERLENSDDLVRYSYTVTRNESFLTGEVFENKGFFTNGYRIEYDNPIVNPETHIDDLFTLRNMGKITILIICSRRDNPAGGTVVTKDFSYFAKWEFESWQDAPRYFNVSLRQMNSYIWFSIVLILGVIVVALILIFAKKGDGKMIPASTKRVRQNYYPPYGQQPPYGQPPYGQPPYGQPPVDPFDNNNNDPFGL